jgi:hypothetical protein
MSGCLKWIIILALLPFAIGTIIWLLVIALLGGALIAGG